MKLEVRGKNGFHTTEAINNYIANKLEKLDKYFHDELSGFVVCKVYGDKTKVEITIPIKGMTLRSEVEHKDMYAAIDLSVDKLERQVRKNKYKMSRSLQDKQGIKNLFVDNEYFEESKKEEFVPVKKKLFKLENLSLDEAITQMELLGHNFYVYKNEKDVVSIVYQRNDGEYGVIETL